MLVAVVSAPPGAVLCDKAQWLATGFNEAGHSVIRCHSLVDLAAADKIAGLVVFDQRDAGCNHNSLAEMAMARRAVWVYWWRDLLAYDRVPLAEQDDLKLFGRLMRGMDVCFVKERALLADFQSLGINAAWLDQACPSEMAACEHPASPEFDLLVLGRTDYPQRRRDVQALVAAGYRVLWAGLPDFVGVPDGVTAHAWVHPTRELPALASRCAVALSVDATQNMPGYHSDRTWLLAGCGIPLVARVPDVGESAGPSELVEVAPQAEVASWIYHDEAGLLACFAQAMDDPAERHRRGEAARRLVMERHTYRQRAQTIASTVARQ